MTDQYVLQKIYNSITGNFTPFVYFRICSHISYEKRPLLHKHFASYLDYNHNVGLVSILPFTDNINYSSDLSLRARKMWLYIQILKLKNQ
jgi:hypothetical protein